MSKNEFKVVIVGAANAGKTALVECYHRGRTLEKYVASANMKMTIHSQRLQTREVDV